MLHVLHDWFGFPDGSVLTNLVASVIGFTIGYFAAIHRKLKKLQRSHDELHAKHDRLHRHLNVPAE